MKQLLKRMAGLLCAVALALSCTGCEVPAVSKKENEITTITVWNYYNSDQLESFNEMVRQFNESVGREKGIVVETYSQGSINDLETNVLESAQGKVGAAELPNIFSTYADTAYNLNEMGLLADLRPYLTEEEWATYVPGFLTEGDFDGTGEVKIFPVAKSTQLLFLNDTDWQKFAKATGAQYSDLATLEGLTRTAELYYNWTDAQTPEPDDGKALFGRDAMANYFLIGAQQLGCTVLEVENGKMTVGLDKATARKLWDNYYVPYIKGYFAASGRFRSDDIKTGNILAYVGSSTSGTYFPDQVSTNDTESHRIEMKVLQDPVFEAGEAVAVQQGAGMAVTKGSEKEIEASVEFLKWFTQPENNILFSVGSGYLPVTQQANSMDAIRASGLKLADGIEQALTQAVDTVQKNRMYTTKAFKNGSEVRNVLDYDLSDLAAADRQTVEQRIAQGQSAEQAQAEFLTDGYFEQWYEQLCDQLNEYAG